MDEEAPAAGTADDHEKRRRLLDRLSQARMTATRLNGLVEVEIDGHGELLRLGIDTTGLDSARLRLVESGIVEAINDAEDQSADLEERLLAQIFGEQ
ncbi:YbaB/EbfC family nucleoid-associated protein [Actinomadura litoris]|uniref:YbaB/EbfC family nucleoid-associated protein n=1 Tax=Actinomadura litoris TaxID=2678616 RepID=UPI001FA6C647|nr:YbaB/EbfC family nucleoid-associated protein [Actinomadura litoris]